MTPPDSDNTNESETRGRLRVPVDYPVLVTGDEGSGHGTVRNLTLAGGEIESHVQVPVGAHVCLHVHPPGARPPIIIGLAVVRWKHGDRFGLEFVRFEGKAKEQLEDMLNQRDAVD